MTHFVNSNFPPVVAELEVEHRDVASQPENTEFNAVGEMADVWTPWMLLCVRPQAQAGSNLNTLW